MSIFPYILTVKLLILVHEPVSCNAKSSFTILGAFKEDSEISKLSQMKVFSPTDAVNYLASSTKNGSISIWDWDKRKIITKFNESDGCHSKSVNSLVFLSTFENNKPFLASGSSDSKIKIWDIENKRLIFNFDESNGGHNQSVEALEFFESGVLASGSIDGTIKLWNVRNGNLISTLILSDKDYSKILIKSENDGYLISGSIKGVIKIWNITNQKVVYTFDKLQNGHNSIISSLIITKNGYLASGSHDGTIKVWDLTDWKLKHTFDRFNNGHIDLIKSLCSLETHLLASGSADGTIKVWDIINGQLKFSLKNDYSVEKLITTTDQNYFSSIFSVGTFLQIKIINLINRNISQTYEASNHLASYSDSINGENGYLAFGWGNYIRLLKINFK